MPLVVTAEAQVTDTGKKFAFSTGGPLGPIQQADPIPGRQGIAATNQSPNGTPQFS